MEHNELFLKRFTENGNKITKILTWSLFAVPINAITSNTLVLLPDLYYSTHPKSKSEKTRLFSDIEIGKMLKSLVFFDNGICVISKYHPDESGEFIPINVVDKRDNMYSDAMKHFYTLWNRSFDCN